MIFKLSFALIGTLCCHHLSGQSLLANHKDFIYSNKEEEIIILAAPPSKNKGDSLELRLLPVMHISNRNEWKVMKREVENGYAIWRIPAKAPVLIRVFNYQYMIEPGDSIHINFSEDIPVYTGRGAEKLKLLDEVARTTNKIVPPQNPKPLPIRSFRDYLEWNDYLDKQLDLIEHLLNEYSAKISPFAYTCLKASLVANVEFNRLYKFNQLSYSATRFKINKESLRGVFDSIAVSPTTKWLLSLSELPGNVIYYYQFIQMSLRRRYNFNNKHDSIKNEALRKIAYYNMAIETYHGHVLENYLAYLVTEAGLRELGFPPEVEKLLAAYYSRKGLPQYIAYVKEYEEKIRQRNITKGNVAPDFVLLDTDGNTIGKSNFLGKIVLMNFWATNCNECEQMATALKKVQNTFKDDTAVVFVNVSIDKHKDQWVQSIAHKKYTIGEGVNLYTDGKGREHPVVKAYNLKSCSAIHLWDPYGRLVVDPLTDPKDDFGESITELIKQQLALLQDGPYVMYNDDSVTVYTFNNGGIFARKLQEVNQETAQTDEYRKTFPIVLKESLNIEPCEFSRPRKMLALSDIEGNFIALRKLLQANDVIDENYNWTFEDGHLIINGDVFDRGAQVTECLWLIYSLEEKAKAKGGYVHFILGNHEIMNLNGNIRYIKEKYKRNVEKLRIPYQTLYSDDSELGRWLRTKNIIEKIGDFLFVHAGISGEVNNLSLSIEEINRNARPYLDKDSIARKSKQITLPPIFDPKESPFWYRLYYQDAEMKIYAKGDRFDTVYKTPMKQIDETLEKFSVNHIVTGHTIIGDTISVHYDGKVINTDTRHASGKTEALLVEDNKLYRVNSRGIRSLLFYSHSDSGNRLFK